MLRSNLTLMSVLAASMIGLMPGRVQAADCQLKPASLDRLPVARSVVIDATAGHLYGSMTRQPHQPSFLNAKEVVLTFDDGPMPWITKSILDTLDTFCAKATFFAVGRMAQNYPDTVKKIIAHGHTLGSHTYSHPYNLPRLKAEAAQLEIERGFAAVTAAAGTPIAPFFRFPGLADSQTLLAYLGSRNFATFTVDVVSNDSYAHDADALAKFALAEIDRRKGGIVLFHDIKIATAKALPHILAGLQARGYSLVHLTTQSTTEPVVSSIPPDDHKVARSTISEGPHITVPFYGTAQGKHAQTKGSAEVAAHDDGARIYGWATTVGSTKSRGDSQPRPRQAHTTLRKTLPPDSGSTGSTTGSNWAPNPDGLRAASGQ